MAEDKDNVVEKRVNKRVIRRRKKPTKVAAPKAQEEAKAKPAEAKTAEPAKTATVKKVVKKVAKAASATEAAPAKKITKKVVKKAEPAEAKPEVKETPKVKAAPEETKEVKTEAPKVVTEEKKVEEPKNIPSAFPGRAQASPEEIRKAVEASRAKSAARKKGREVTIKQTRGKPKRSATPSAATKMRDSKFDIADSQAAAQKAETTSGGKHGKKRRKEAYTKSKDEIAEEKFNLNFRRKKLSEQKSTEITTPKAIKRIIKIHDVVVISELAKQMSVKAGDVLKKLMDLGVMATLNQSIDIDTAQIVATEFGFEVVNEAFQEEDLINKTEDKPEDLEPRAPIITVMGHVDHGKTTLLDSIRKTKVVDGEAGGITQHIGAYKIHKKIGDKDHSVVFVDTPGHAAFTAMRARGAQVTDLVVLVVAADDGIMPQTIEAINHAKAAKVPILVAVNKCDKPDANVDRIKQSLTEFELVPEEWGGTTIIQEVSALKGTGISELLEMLVLQTEILELKANPKTKLEGIVIEGKLEKGRGPVATVIIRNGTVKVGDYIICGVHSGRVRALVDDTGKSIKTAGPATPVEIIGLGGVPNAGDIIHAVENEKVGKEISSQRARSARETELRKTTKVSLENLNKMIAEGNIQDLNIVLKTDVQGTVDAIVGGLEKLSTDKVRVKIVQGMVGAITETDIQLASASNALVLGFNIRPSRQVTELAASEKITIKTYTVIYELLDEVRDAMEGMLAPKEVEKYHSRIQIRQTFSVSKIGTIAGCMVLDGKVQRTDKVRVLRDSVIIYDGKLASLKRFKDDAKEVAQGYECGLSIENFNDLKVDDELETYVIEKVADKL